MTRLRTLQLLPCSPQIGSAEVTGTITLDADSFYSFACEFSADQMVFVWVRDVSILPPVTAAVPARTGQCCDLECCILPFDAPSLSSSLLSSSSPRVATSTASQHLICHTQPIPFGNSPSSTDGCPENPLPGTKGETLPVVIHAYSLQANSSTNVSVQWAHLATHTEIGRASCE